MSRYSNSQFFSSICFTFAINVLSDRILFAEKSSNWNCLSFEQSTEFSWLAEFAEKSAYYCYDVDIETQNF